MASTQLAITSTSTLPVGRGDAWRIIRALRGVPCERRHARRLARTLERHVLENPEAPITLALDRHEKAALLHAIEDLLGRETLSPQLNAIRGALLVDE